MHSPYGSIYAIIDLVADAVLGGFSLHRHDAAAIRMFGDIATDKNFLIAMHPADYQLVRLGYLRPDHGLDAEPHPVVIITGAQWKAAQQASDNGGAQ